MGCYEVIWDRPKTDDQIDKSNLHETQLAVLVNGHPSEWFQMTVACNRQGDPLPPQSLLALFPERIMDKIKNTENSGVSVHGNRVNNLRFADDIDIIVPRHRRSMFGRRAFSVAGPMEWNSLPDSLRDPARSTDSFRSALKTHLFAALRYD